MLGRGAGIEYTVARGELVAAVAEVAVRAGVGLIVLPRRFGGRIRRRLGRDPMSRLRGAGLWRVEIPPGHHADPASDLSAGGSVSATNSGKVRSGAANGSG